MRRRAVVVSAALAVLASGSLGCLGLLGLEPVATRSYVLEAGAPAAGEVVSSETAIIGLLPVAIPSYLDRPAIVTREGDGRLLLAERDLWAEGIDRGIARVLAQRLTRLLPGRLFVSFPWRRSQVLDGQLALVVERFDGPLGGEVELDARWTLLDADGRTVIAARRAALREPTTDPSYDAMVAAMSRALGRLAEAIAESVPGQPGSASSR